MLRLNLLIACVTAFAAISPLHAESPQDPDGQHVLVFSKTLRFRHDSIPAGIAALRELGRENGFSVEATEDAAQFDDATLQKYDAVVFLSTTGNVLNETQEAAFQRYIQSGGGFVGIHSAAATEYEWSWFNRLVGAYLLNHPMNPGVRTGAIDIYDKDHPATAGLPARWEHAEEWYNFRNMVPGLHVLANLDENSYEGGMHGSHHPIAWTQEFDGGRAFYTALGHEAAAFSDPLFRQHLLGGLRYAMGTGVRNPALGTAQPTPPEHRFTKTILTQGLKQPMELAITPDGRVFFTELITGDIQVYDPTTNKVDFVHHLDVISRGGSGLIGITFHPQFPQKPWAYVYYSPDSPEDDMAFRLSRFTVDGNRFDPGSEKVMLTIPVIAAGGSHHGGSMAWDRAGNLYLSTGDTTSPHPAKGFAPLDERPGIEHVHLDAQRAASNTNALTGKILRITPQDDGTYSIPEGNLYPPGTEKTRPEIYIMGTRNPYRIAIDPRTDTLYWGEIGPDAGNDTERGPRGYDEFNQAKEPGNYGWPYFVGNNRAYPKWDYVAEKPGDFFDPNAPENHSPNNTGLIKLPPAKAPFIWYPYAPSLEFPVLGEGGRSAMAGEFFLPKEHRADIGALPEYYKGALFVFDWMRNWVMALRFDENEKWIGAERFLMAKGDFRRPIDLAFTREGVLYVLEYGSVYGANNPDAQLSRIEYIAGPLPPVADAGIVDPEKRAQALEKNKGVYLTNEQREPNVVTKAIAGAAPLTVQLLARKPPAGDDRLSANYRWSILEAPSIQLEGAEVTHTFNQPGTYHVVLTVTDTSGAAAKSEVTVNVGNQPPQVKISTRQNRSFFWNGDRLQYEIEISDLEDGQKLSPSKATLQFQPVPKDVTTPGVQEAKVTAASPVGAEMMAGSDCRACHTRTTSLVGPSLVAIAQRYKSDPNAVEYLTQKIIVGGGGVWGQTPMPAHPQLPAENVAEMAKYILSLARDRASETPLASAGVVELNLHNPDDRFPQYRLTAAYTDNGANGQGPNTVQDELVLKPARFQAAFADGMYGFNRFRDEVSGGSDKSHLIFRDVDMTQLRAVSLFYSASQPGELELRADSFIGPVIAKGTFQKTTENESERRVRLNFTKFPEGRHDLFLVVRKREKPDKQLLNPKWIEFHK